MKKHTLIVGDHRKGGSAVVQRLCAQIKKPVGGYITKSLPYDESGFHPIYIHPAALPVERRVYTQENLIGTCDRKEHIAHLDVFNTLGVSYLQNVPQDGLVLMDEIGFMEVKAKSFTDKILELLDGDVPVLASVKRRPDVEFLVQLCNHPNAEVYYLTEENPDGLYEHLLEKMKALALV